MSTIDAPMVGARIPPHNLDAEQSVLGAMLLSRDAIAAVAETISADDFYKPAHGHVYEAVTALYGSGHPVDPVTVAEELERSGLLESVGGAATLISIQDRTPATTNASRYAQIVSELALLRRMIVVANEIAELGYQRPDDVIKAVDEAEARIYDVAQRRLTTSTAPLRDLLSASLDRLEHLYEQGDALTGTPTGFLDLDDLLSGLQPSALVVVGARPAMGKTAFALGLAANAALSAASPRPTLVFSLEMSQIEITQRLLCSQAKVDATRIRNGKLSADDWTKISHTVGRLAEAPIWIDDNPNVSVMEIRSKARRLKSKIGDLGLIVVDYIQLMSGRAGAESRQVEVAEISRGLKILARELEVPVVALAQLNRGLEARTEKRPMLSDLRESGSLEQDADVVMFLYRDEVYNPESADAGMAEVLVAKHRAGPTGLIRLAFNGKYTLFENMAKSSTPH
jgi:replicative DNA helicase